MNKSELIVGLDIGTTKICAVVGELTESGLVDVVGIGTSVSTGLRKGVVVNIEQTVQSIRKAVEDAELMAGCEIHSVYVGIAGSHIMGINSHGVIAVKGGEVAQRDVERYAEALGAVVEVEGAAAALGDGLDDRQAQAAPGAVGVAPEAPGQVRKMFGGDTRPAVAYPEADLPIGGLHAQADRGARRGVAQGVVQQVAQGRDGQAHRHFHRSAGEGVCQDQVDALIVAGVRILDRQPRDFFGAGLQAIVE